MVERESGETATPGGSLCWLTRSAGGLGIFQLLPQLLPRGVTQGYGPAVQYVSGRGKYTARSAFIADVPQFHLDIRKQWPHIGHDLPCFIASPAAFRDIDVKFCHRHRLSVALPRMVAC